MLQFDPPGKTLRLTLDVQTEMLAALDAVEKESRFRALMIRSAKPGQFAKGPSLAGWKAMQTEGTFREWSGRGQEIWNRLHNLKIPTIAWVQGECFGPGFELVLACDRIILVNNRTTTLGFAELDVGLIPSWGGFGPLVRRVGVKKALPLALAGRRISVPEAANLGLADTLASSDAPDYHQIAMLGQKRDHDLWTRRTWKDAIVERFAAGRRLLYRATERVHRERLPDDLPAPRRALQTLKEFIERGTAAGQMAATAALVELGQTPAFTNLVRLHELREWAQTVPGKPNSAPRESVVGILGTSALAMHVLMEVVRRERNVILREADETRLGIAIMKLVQSLGRDLEGGLLDQHDTKRMLSRIRSTITWKNFDEAHLVLDARERSGDVNEISDNVGPQTPIVVAGFGGRLAEAGRGQERLVGLSVPGPVGFFPLVEWRRTEGTDAGIVRLAREWFVGLGWTPVQVGDLPGLLLARLWTPAWNEMVTLLREGVALEAIERALVRFGMGRGPFDYLDAYGLDHVNKMIEAVRSAVEPRVSIDPFWSEVLERGWRGRISGKGFYSHGRRKRANHLLVNWLRQEGPLHGPHTGKSSATDIRERIVLLMVNEAFRCLDEKRVERADDLDLALMLTDWAPHRGGPIAYARGLGLPAVVARLRELAAHGERYEPCPRLLQEAAAGS